MPAHQRAAVQVGASRRGVQLSVSGGNEIRRQSLAAGVRAVCVLVDVFLSVCAAYVRLHIGALHEFRFASVSLREVFSVFLDDL